MRGSALVRQARSIGDVLEAVREIDRRWDREKEDYEIWFRGVSRRKFDLVPGLYRPGYQRYDYEETLFEAFKSFAVSHVGARPTNDWEWYFMAQHYGMPTRLLDWTDNLFAALYFALEPHVGSLERFVIEERIAKRPGKSDFSEDSPVVWLLDPGSLNRATTRDPAVFSPGGPFTNRYLPTPMARPGRRGPVTKPIALFPPRATARITAQQGLFTIHGRGRECIHELARKMPIRMAAVALDLNAAPLMWSDLRTAGVNRLSLFPELESVAPHVKWLFQPTKRPEEGPSTRRN
jgi:hypothetical protein